jgi:hypothetical protein
VLNPVTAWRAAAGASGACAFAFAAGDGRSASLAVVWLVSAAVGSRIPLMAALRPGRSQSSMWRPSWTGATWLSLSCACVAASVWPGESSVTVVLGAAVMGLVVAYAVAKVGCHYAGCCRSNTTEFRTLCGVRLPTLPWLEAGASVVIAITLMAFAVRSQVDAVVGIGLVAHAAARGAAARLRFPMRQLGAIVRDPGVGWLALAGILWAGSSRIDATTLLP